MITGSNGIQSKKMALGVVVGVTQTLWTWKVNKVAVWRNGSLSREVGLQRRRIFSTTPNTFLIYVQATQRQQAGRILLDTSVGV